MKRFIVSVLCASVFFIGLGSLVEKTGAKFKSDERALALIAQARQAIGGEANIKNVRSMTIAGNSTHIFEAEGIQRNEGGSWEINFELPGKFNKMVRIGNPDDAAGEGDFHKEVDVIVMRKDGGNENVEDVKVDGKRKIIVKNADGTIATEDIKGDKTEIILERKSKDDSAEWKTEDGRKIVVERDAKVVGVRQNEMFRTTFALLLSAPDGTDANYLYAGEDTVDGNSCDVIEVQSAGSSFKLYLDKSSHLPRMLSYMGMPMMKVVKLERQPGDAPKEDTKIFVRKMGKAELVEHQVKFSDFRSVGGIQLPHRWSQTVGGKAGETTEISSYEINPANITEKFREPKVFIRTKKPQ